MHTVNAELHQRHLVDQHRPITRPYDNAPGFHLARCPVCDGSISRVRQDGTQPYACTVWRDALQAGVASVRQLP